MLQTKQKLNMLPSIHKTPCRWEKGDSDQKGGKQGSFIFGRKFSREFKRHLDAKVGVRAARTMADWKSFSLVTLRT